MKKLLQCVSVISALLIFLLPLFTWISTGDTIFIPIKVVSFPIGLLAVSNLAYKFSTKYD